MTPYQGGRAGARVTAPSSAHTAKVGCSSQPIGTNPAVVQLRFANAGELAVFNSDTDSDGLMALIDYFSRAVPRSGLAMTASASA